MSFDSELYFSDCTITNSLPNSPSNDSLSSFSSDESFEFHKNPALSSLINESLITSTDSLETFVLEQEPQIRAQGQSQTQEHEEEQELELEEEQEEEQQQKQEDEAQTHTSEAQSQSRSHLEDTTLQNTERTVKLKPSLKLLRSNTLPLLFTKKSVKFTDFEDVCFFHKNDSPSSVSNASSSDEEEFDDVEEEKTYEITNLNFINKTDLGDVSRLNVKLNDVRLVSNRLVGNVFVKNLAFEKKISIKLTFNNWKSFSTIPAFYTESMNESVDKFQFNLNLANYESKLSQRFKLNFCVKYQVENCEFWDNNNNNNNDYCIKFKQSKAFNKFNHWFDISEFADLNNGLVFKEGFQNNLEW